MSKLAKLTFALVALSVLSALGACSAMAEEAVNVERWVVTSSGESSSLSAVTPEVRITDGSSEVICGESTIAGTIELGEEVLGRELAEVTSSTWGGGSCEGPLGIEFAIAQEGTWLLSADSGLAEGELVMGRLTNVAAKLRGAFCSLRVSGELGGEYSNSSQTLRVTSSSLLISEVSGCFGLVKNGDKPTFEATYEITSPTELALGVPLKLTAENVGGLPGAPNKCLYTLKFETCKIEVTNNSVFPVKIVKKEVTGISAGARYKIINEKCTVNLVLKEETLLIPGGKCTDDVQMISQPVAPEEWFNGYQVEVVQTANPKNRTANAPVLLIAK